MLKEATSRGLAVDRAFSGKYHGYAQDRLYRSESAFYRGLDAGRRRAGRGRRPLADQPPSARLTLDPSVMWRINTDPTEKKKNRPSELQHPDLGQRYRPDNVLRFLAGQPDLDAYLASLGVDPAHVPDDVRQRIRALRP
jgi:hypothetical protein